MDFEQKISLFMQDMQDRNEQAYSAAPLFYRQLWKLGIQEPPPYFSSFKRNAVIQGGGFGCLMFFISWVLLWLLDVKTEDVGLLTIPFIIVGVFFGLIIAALLAQKKKQFGLVDWQLYGKKSSSNRYGSSHASRS